jgi:hypothetical protein
VTRLGAPVRRAGKRSRRGIDLLGTVSLLDGRRAKVVHLANKWATVEPEGGGPLERHQIMELMMVETGVRSEG